MTRRKDAHLHLIYTTAEDISKLRLYSSSFYKKFKRVTVTGLDWCIKNVVDHFKNLVDFPLRSHDWPKKVTHQLDTNVTIFFILK